MGAQGANPGGNFDPNNFQGANGMGMMGMMGGNMPGMGQFPSGGSRCTILSIDQQNNMSNMGGFPQGYSMNGNGAGAGGQGGNQGNTQGMTQEQMQQMIQRQLMQGQGQWMNGMNPGGGNQ